MRRLTHLAVRVLWLVALAAMLIGIPIVLGRVIGTPRTLVRIDRTNPWSRLDAGELRVLLVAALGLLVWLAWLRLVAAFVVETVCAVAGCRRPRIAWLGGAQSLAAIVVGGLVLIGPGSSSAAGEASPGTLAVSVQSTGVSLGWSDAGFLAAGVIAVVALTRNRHLRRASVPATVGRSAEVVEHLERQLRDVVPQVEVDRLQHAWATALASGTSGQPCAALTSSDATVTVMFLSTAPEPPPGVVRASQRSWVFPNRVWGVVDSAARVTPGDEVHGGVPVGAVPHALIHLGRRGPDAIHLPLAVASRLVVDGPEFAAERIRETVRCSVEVCARLQPNRVNGEAAQMATAATSTMSAPWTLEWGEGEWWLEPLHEVVVPVGLERHDLAGVRALLDAAALAPTPLDGSLAAPHPPAETDGQGAPSVSPTPTGLPAQQEPSSAALERPTEWTFMVRVLGPVDVLATDGTIVAFERSKSLELLTWLVLHRRSATREAARAALWEVEVRDSSFANVVSEARRALSRHITPAEHHDWVARPHGELMPVHREVVSDADVVNSHVSRARALTRNDGQRALVIEELRAALSLVRGAPFIGSGFGWADAEATTSNLTLLVVGTAMELGELELEADNVEGAFWATSVGLSVLPGHEELVALRLRTHARAGDPVGVRHEWQMYQRSLIGDPWQTEPSPWLEELVVELLGEPAVA